MLRDTEAIGTIAVKNLKTASAFYEGKLGLTRGPGEEEQVITYRSGSSSLLVYVSEFAGTNRATAVTWAVDNVDEATKALEAKGVEFEHYDFPGVTLQGDVHVMGKRRNSWFKDPDGNILSIVNK